MYKNMLYDLDLPSEFPQHSELNGGLFVRNANINRTMGNLYVRQTYQSEACKLVSVFEYFNYILFHIS